MLCHCDKTFIYKSLTPSAMMDKRHILHCDKMLKFLISATTIALLINPSSVLSSGNYLINLFSCRFHFI